MPKHTTILLLTIFVLVFCLADHGAYAFGAGNIPSFAYLEGKAFRHGDIEDAIAELVKKGGGGLAMVGLKSKFGGLDVKRIYFGNWLRDYSQAVDIAGLKKLQLQTIINLCMALGFLAHGYATNEFEVTAERLGVYLPTEHIDNPKGYGDGEDARKYHPQLRGPVNPAELDIDPRTGMKNYIANEDGGWDTSKALVRRTLEQCIHIGRRHRAQGNKADEYEAYRLLGQALHTLEDYPAHSNFCELAMLSNGIHEVYAHVGDHVRVQAPNGKSVPPIITGTFGSNDFIHSLLGEASDHINQASVTDLNKELNKAHSSSQRSGPGGAANPADVLRDLLFKLPGGTGGDMSRDMEGIERLRASPGMNGKRPEDMSPQELHAVLWQVLSFRDSVVKKIEKTIEKIPGLGPLIEKIMDSISVFVFTTLEPYLKPVLKSATSGLSSASSEVIDSHDQYEVFNDPRASDPTHSFLSKDHFNLILNEPAGNLAMIIVRHAVNIIVKAWSDNSMDVRRATGEILECLFHPDFHDRNSKIQREMLQYMQDWFKGLGNKQSSIVQRLSKNAVRNHENIRAAGEGGKPEAHGTWAHSQGMQFQQNITGYVNNIPGVAQAQNLFGGGAGNRRDGPAGPGGIGSEVPYQPSVPGSFQDPLPSSGEAGAFYGGGSSAPQQSGPPHSSAPPPQHHQEHGGHAGYTPSYAAPPGAPGGYAPSYGGGGPGGGYPPPQSSYPGGPPPQSSYPGGPPPQSSYPGGPNPSFPSAFPSASPFSGGGGPPSFPQDQPYGGHMNSPPPSFPGASPYGGPPAPSFPGANPYPQEHHQHQHHHHGPPGGYR